MKIAICGLMNSPNLGDDFIAKSLAWIICDVMRQNGEFETPEFIYADIQAANDEVTDCSGAIQTRVRNLYAYAYYGLPTEMIHYCLKIIALKTRSLVVKNTLFKIRHFIWKHARNLGKRHYKYCDYKLKDADLIVVAGGGLLEYSYNAFQESLNFITHYAEKHSIPVIFNAIGRAGEFDKRDFRCKVLMDTFQRNCVKYVSARDSRETVQECVGSRLNVKLLGDAAFCVDEAFNVQAKKSKVIGIGLIRENAFNTYSDGLNSNEGIDLFCGIAKELENRGYSYEFFTNGLSSDYETALKVINKLGISKKKLVKRPTDSKTLLETISKYEAIITCRMHSSIGAFALGIPSIILSWNEKVDKYMDLVGYPERAIKQKDFNPSYIVEKMETALKEGISTENRMRMKKLARESVEDYIDFLIL